jgi:hypothetical protein
MNKSESHLNKNSKSSQTKIIYAFTDVNRGCRNAGGCFALLQGDWTTRTLQVCL